ncbi:MAG: hypothetical protein P0Y49_17235 [Candidatus Pedobacter colombiensis]|uniref:Uncharacterized protein n=1 Tax=Candidatus Pedobacter colombiensis TaxID=3121371 RepID=A0AAJ5W7C8_9SPHI|nr:hypothetical protein [Pedobacter sp.]WEK18536.1 MAG: hypothetical protein P0Y49_17235 [Pedobacter sp.]
MRDKEMDQLFKDRFENAEIEPSAGLWTSIEKHLEIKPVKRKFPLYWFAAAAAVAIVIMSLLLTKEEKIQLYALDHFIPPLVEKAAPISIQKESGTQSPHRTASTKLTVKNKIAVVKAIDTVRATNIKKDLMVMQPIKEDMHLHAVVERLQPVVNSNTLVLASDQSLVTGIDEVINENDQVEKKGIRNVGDLINFVVDKLDKREEKLLQFKTDDDDNSSLIAINIGFIKFNSKKHK